MARRARRPARPGTKNWSLGPLPEFSSEVSQIDIGKQMYADCGGRVKFKSFQIANYQSLGLSDEAIRHQWREFLDQNRAQLGSDKKWRKGAGILFWNRLKEVANSISRGQETENGIVIPEPSTHVVETH